ncbi:hypothetical protein [Chitinophaga pinensis]|uniref:Uncharacterized protein n=1 Tax=Chitinophaga pinensis (strain ATCC 43595 / DSM 2588 / LMG 13176 / NBRC 15968 / NCIMB 11800 / UQM 2034) TaxID=485918 RepID=A0A979G209_CHIPD|nr:hypothetical protein [Chitinophaga pinensis]ACU59252.1 hypothetical protein Cpin_1756 [Chitinophaga pinensis DSM 2588]
MDNLDIVQILGTGLSGFGFLLMYLAYKLISSLVPLPNVNPNIIKMINRYMLVCFIMTVTVGVFTFMTTSYKNNVISDQAALIKSKDTVVNILTAAQKAKLLSDSLSRNMDSPLAGEVKTRQNSYLDTLQKYIDGEHNPVQHERFNRYKESLTTITDSLTMDNLDRRRKEFLKEKYVGINDSITRFSLKLADAKSVVAPK